jgi:hypothetical protein
MVIRRPRPEQPVLDEVSFAKDLQGGSASQDVAYCAPAL